jgi:hypothetical protein
MNTSADLNSKNGTKERNGFNVRREIKLLFGQNKMLWKLEES